MKKNIFIAMGLGIGVSTAVFAYPISDQANPDPGLTGSRGAKVEQNQNQGMSDTTSMAPEQKPDQATQANTENTATGAVSDSKLTGDTITRAQEALVEKGYSVSPDGVVGPKTQAAIRRYQKDSGLTQSGSFDYQTLKELDVVHSEKASP